MGLRYHPLPDLPPGHARLPVRRAGPRRLRRDGGANRAPSHPSAHRLGPLPRETRYRRDFAQPRLLLRHPRLQHARPAPGRLPPGNQRGFRRYRRRPACERCARDSGRRLQPCGTQLLGLPRRPRAEVGFAVQGLVQHQLRWRHAFRRRFLVRGLGGQPGSGQAQPA